MPDDFNARSGGVAAVGGATATGRQARFGQAATAVAGPASLIPVGEIRDRAGSTRDADPGHVERLADSIANLGLIEPLVVDRNHVLLAGLHRLQAIKHLQDSNPSAYAGWFDKGVPCVVRQDVDAGVDARRALEIEIAENEQRRPYTKVEVLALADRLRAAGYRVKEGRLRAGEKSLQQELRIITGKSRTTIHRILSGQKPAPTRAPHSLSTVISHLERYKSAFPDSLREQADSMIEKLGHIRDTQPNFPD